MNIIGNKKIFLTVSALAVLASVVSIAVFGLRQGVDFTGGTLWQLAVPETVTKEAVQEIIPGALIITQPANNSIIIRTGALSEEEHQTLLLRFRELDAVEELRFETIGPVIGSELKRKAVWAFAFVLAAISLYIAFAFRKVSKPVSSWKYGMVTLVTLFHDAIIPTGMMAALGYFAHAEIDTNFVVAILAVIGFSVHDTIVVFDRIREKLISEAGKKMQFADAVNASVNETLARSINTSFTLILVLLAMYFLGAVTLTNFILVILVGTIVGTYSSIFLASPLLTVIARKSH